MVSGYILGFEVINTSFLKIPFRNGSVKQLKSMMLQNPVLGVRVESSDDR